MRFEQLVTVAAFTSPWEAQLAKARLESDGIEAMVADEHLVRMYWGISNAVGGVKLQVRAEDAAAAAAALQGSEALPEIYLVTAEEAGRRRCPGCNSDNLSYERWSRLAFMGSWLLLGFPVPIPRNRWSCRRCGALWREDELRGGRPLLEEAIVTDETIETVETVIETGLDPAGLVTVARFPDPWAAHLARTRLEAEGIDACVFEERLPVVNLLSGELLALNRVAVLAPDAERAVAVLAEVAEVAEGTQRFRNPP